MCAGGTAADLVLRDAQAADRAALSALQRRSSLHFPRYRSQLAAHPELFDLPQHQIDAGLVRVAVDGDTAVGFAVLLPAEDGSCELDGLFVEPARMGGGIGRLLVEDSMRIARERGARRIAVVANPDATAFYEGLGFEDAGEAETQFGPARRLALRA